VSVHLRALFAACCFLVARKGSIITCKYIAGKFVRGSSDSELERARKARHRRGLLFYKLQRGLQRIRVAEYTRDTTPSCLCSGDRPNLFTPTPGLARFAKGVNYVQNLRRDAEIIISARIAAVVFNATYSTKFNLRAISFVYYCCDPFFKLQWNNNEIKMLIRIKTQKYFYCQLAKKSSCFMYML